MSTIYQVILCKKDGTIEVPYSYDEFKDARTEGQRIWDSVSRLSDKYTGVTITDGRSILCTWTAEGLHEFKYEDTSTGYRYDRETAKALLEHRYSRWLFRMDLSEEFGSFLMERIGAEFSAGSILWANPGEFELAYEQEIERKMDDMDTYGNTHQSLRVAEEWWSL